MGNTKDMAGTQKRRETPKIWRELESSRDRLRTSSSSIRQQGRSFQVRRCDIVQSYGRGLHLVFGARGVGVIVIARAGLGGGRVRMRLRKRRKPCAAPLVFLEREQKLITCSGFTRLWQTETD